MRTRWTTEEMESVLKQLNDRFLPFRGYCFSQKEKGLILLGTGGYANVYEMERVTHPDRKYALKVLGFGEKHVDSEAFRRSVQVQKDLAAFQTDVVKIIDFAELRISLDEQYRVLDAVKVPEFEEQVPDGQFLILQFVLMEKLVPILSTDCMGRPALYPEQLANYDESEIMKLAYHIGTALARAHAKQLLHRDVKLENVFYDPVKKVYKLGDFGIAKMTDDGMASTVAFTKGYGAPEVVGAVDERYDHTADIYSFGMMLYLLLNGLRFPDSENYHVNVAKQYSKGYELPYPEYEDYKLCGPVYGMCRYDPDERYQSMEKVLNDIEGIMIGNDLRLKKENIKSPYVAGMICYVAGMILWKLTHMPELTPCIDPGGYLFLALSGYAYWLNLKKKEHHLLTILILGLGGYLLITTGFTWWKLLFVLGVAFSSESFAGMAAIGGLAIDLISGLLQDQPQIYDGMQPYKWLSVLFLSFAGVLFLQYSLLKERDIKTNRIYFKRNAYWMMVLALYGCLFFQGVVFKNIHGDSIQSFGWLAGWMKIGLEYNFMMLGLGGVVLSLIWEIRAKLVTNMPLLRL